LPDDIKLELIRSLQFLEETDEFSEEEIRPMEKRLRKERIISIVNSRCEEKILMVVLIFKGLCN